MPSLTAHYVILMPVKVKIEIGILLISLFCFCSPGRADFKDVPATQPASSAIGQLLAAGIIAAPANKRFDGNEPVTMFQLAVIMERVLVSTGQVKEIETSPLEEFYNDVPAKHYAYKAVQDLTKLGVFTVAGRQRFDGEALLDRYTFYSYYALFLEKLAGQALTATSSSFYPDVRPDHSSFIFLQKLVEAGLLDGIGYFNGDRIVKRYEMAIFTAKLLDHYAAERAKAQAKENEASIEANAGAYLDIPEDNYAGPAVNELAGEGILIPGEDKKFYGDQLINEYLMIDLTGKIIERIMVGETGELGTANPAQAFKDVPVSHFAYRSILKLIKLGIIPPGDRTQLLYADRKISRYQLAFFMLPAIEKVLSAAIKFKPANPALGYADVPEDCFAYSTIQKLIWLGVLEGGSEKKFNGEQYVDRYELAFFTVNLVKAVFLKLKELENFAPARPVEYGFKTYLNTQLSATQIVNGKGPGLNYNDLSAHQSVKLSLDRNLGNNLCAFASLTSLYDFGSGAAASSPYLDSGYVLLNNPPYILQAGRSYFYKGYTPFGNSLFVDTTADMVLANFDPDIFNLNASVGKLGYASDLSRDSNFGLISVTPKMPGLFSWLEFTLGGSLITNLPDPLTLAPLPARLTQSYGGVKLNLFSLFELTAENANLSLNNPEVIPLIGVSPGIVDLTASQYALTYFANDNGYIISLGYQKIGNNYYLASLASPALYLGAGQGTESVLFKTRFFISPGQNIGGEVAGIRQNGASLKTVLNGTYNARVFDLAYWNLTLTRVFSSNSTVLEQTSLSSSFAVSF